MRVPGGSQAGAKAGKLLSVNVGLPRDVPWQGKTVRTAIWKEPVDGPRMVRQINIDGDDQADRAAHGCNHRAVFVYQIDSYWYWEELLGRDDFTYGQFGENLTVEGLADDEVCTSDHYQIGQAIFEVTQPRVTCFRVGIRMNEPRMPSLLVAHHRPGFYSRGPRRGHASSRRRHRPPANRARATNRRRDRRVALAAATSQSPRRAVGADQPATLSAQRACGRIRLSHLRAHESGALVQSRRRRDLRPAEVSVWPESARVCAPRTSARHPSRWRNQRERALPRGDEKQGVVRRPGGPARWR